MSPGEVSTGLFLVDALEDLTGLRPRPWKSSGVLTSKRDILIAGRSGGSGLLIRSVPGFAGTDMLGLGFGCTLSKP